jgi:hypothetical protein
MLPPLILRQQLSRMGSNTGKWPAKAAPNGVAITANQVGFLIFGRTPSVDGRPRASRRDIAREPTRETASAGPAIAHVACVPGVSSPAAKPRYGRSKRNHAL